MKYLTLLFAAIALAVLYFFPPTMFLAALAVGIVAVCLGFGMAPLLRDRIAETSGNNIDALTNHAESSAQSLVHQATWLRDPALMLFTLMALIWTTLHRGFVWTLSGLASLFRPVSATA